MALPEEKQIIRVKQSSNGDRESVTVMPLFKSDGTLHETLYIQFKEPNGEFPKVKAVFPAPNVVVACGTTSIMSYETFAVCLEKCIAPAIANLPKVLLLLDSWKPFRNHDFIRDHLPLSCNVSVLNIPPGGTSRIQPADVGLYRTHKLILKAVHDHVRAFDVKIDLHGRDGQVKLHSLIHRALCHKRFHNFLAYAWYKSGYHDVRPPHYESPVDVLLPRHLLSRCSIHKCCEPVAFVLCVWCNEYFCALHFFGSFHWC